MPRFLVLQLDRLGDVIQTSPLFNELVRTIPDTRIDVAVVGPCAEILCGLPGIQHIWVSDPVVLDGLARTFENGVPDPVPPEAEGFVQNFSTYDCLINITQTHFSAWVSSRIAAPQKLGAVLSPAGERLIHGQPLAYLLSFIRHRKINAFNLADLYRALLEESEVPGPDARPHVWVSPDPPAPLPPRPFAAIAPSTSGSRQRWPQDSFRKLIDSLAEAGVASVLVGSVFDYDQCEELRASCLSAPTNRSGETTVPELARLVKEADVVVCADTGVAHVAAAVGTPVVALFCGRALYRETAPWSAGNIILQAPFDGTYSPPEAISPEVALLAVLYRLGRTDQASLTAAVQNSGVTVWETAFLPPEADPVGGLTYRPLHHVDPSWEDALVHSLRHALAREFRSSGPVPTSAELAQIRMSYEDSPRDARWDEEHTWLRNGLLRALEASERAVTALESPENSSRPSLHIEQVLVALETLKARTDFLPFHAWAVNYLDWMVRLLPDLPPLELLRAHGETFARLVRILDTTAHAARNKFANQISFL